MFDGLLAGMLWVQPPDELRVSIKLQRNGTIDLLRQVQVIHHVDVMASHTVVAIVACNTAKTLLCLFTGIGVHWSWVVMAGHPPWCDGFHHLEGGESWICDYSVDNGDENTVGPLHLVIENAEHNESHCH